MADPQTDKPDYKNQDYKDMAPAWQIVRDVSGGTKTMRERGKVYLPQETAEKIVNYERRLCRSVLFNAYKKTRGALTGMVFKKNPVIADDVPPEIVTQLENIDLAGTHIDVFAKELFEDAFEGHAFILVEYEKGLGEGATLADAKAAGTRPYWVKYKVDQAVNWRTTRIDGEEHLTQITFKECAYEPDGEYEEKEVTKYRVFKMVAASPETVGGVVWELWRVVTAAGKQTLVLEDSGPITLDRIPVAIVYGKRLGLMKSEPPLLDLAYLNIAHWQEYSDYRNILHIAQVPLLKRIGANAQQQEVEIGPGTSIDVDQGGDVGWVEIQGKGIAAARQELVDVEQRMAVMGLSILSQKSDTEITATEKRQDFEERQSELSTMARSLKDALELALEFHAEYLGMELPGDGGSIELGVEESELTLTAKDLQVLLMAVQSNNLSLETFLTVILQMLSQTGMLPDDINVKDEVKRIDEATKANQAQALSGMANKAVKGAPPAVQGLFGATSIPGVR